MNASNRAGGILAIASGKGGVGKTWLAITLAHAWARAGCSVLLCDGDLGLANIDVQLGVAPPGDLAGILAGRLTFEAAVMQHPAGFSLLSGSSGSGSLSALPPKALGELLRGLRALAPCYDRVVVDLGAGLDLPLRQMAVFADRLLVVATDEPTSLTDAYAVLKLYASDRRHGPAADESRSEPRVIVNQASSALDGRRTYQTLSKACEKFLGLSPKLAGVVRRDEHVRAAIRRQMPLLDHAPACPAARDVVALLPGL